MRDGVGGIDGCLVAVVRRLTGVGYPVQLRPGKWSRPSRSRLEARPRVWRVARLLRPDLLLGPQPGRLCDVQRTQVLVTDPHGGSFDGGPEYLGLGVTGSRRRRHRPAGGAKVGRMLNLGRQFHGVHHRATMVRSAVDDLVSERRVRDPVGAGGVNYCDRGQDLVDESGFGRRRTQRLRIGDAIRGQQGGRIDCGDSVTLSHSVTRIRGLFREDRSERRDELGRTRELRQRRPTDERGVE